MNPTDRAKTGTVRTTCALDCPDRCSILAEKGPSGLRLRGDPTHPFTKGLLCRKIHRQPARLNSPDRIVHPWIRADGRLGPFRPATWQEAMEAAGEAIVRARDDDQASILSVRSAGAMGAGKDFVDLVFALMGARSTTGSLCDIAGTEAVKMDAGAVRMNDPAEIDRADTIVLWGKNPRASSIHVAAQVIDARRRGVPVVAVTPDASGLRGLADHVVHVRPGRDRYLALAVAGLLTPMVSPPWDRTPDRVAFEALLVSLDLETLLDLCGVAEADAHMLARTYARSPRVATIVGWGIQRYIAGGETVRALHALSFLAGSLGREGGGFYYSVPSQAVFTSMQRSIEKAGARGAATPLRLPVLAQELAAADPPVRVAWLTATNIVNQGPDSAALKTAFEKIETVVAVDAFWTETARAATIVLPPALWLEEEDIVGSAWRPELAAVRRVVDPPGQCRTDFEIAMDLAARLGIGLPCDYLDEWLAMRVPGGPAQLAQIRAEGWIDPGSEKVVWRERSAHPDGRFRLLTKVSPPLEPHADRPLHLLTLIRGSAMHSQMDPAEQTDPLKVRLHPATAASLCLTSGAAVRVTGRVGHLEGVLEVDEALHPTAVACPRGGWIECGQGVNVVTEAAATDFGDGTAYYETTVRVEPI